MIKKILVFTLLLCCAAGVFAGAPDVRILIDVSGSMRKTDPQNLRVPALRLVNGLLPLGSRAGVWLFAENTEVLAEPGVVDDAWKKRTATKLSDINSRGLFTNIEQAINTASVGWTAPDPDVDRHLILLTDGLVDVSKDGAESAASRKRVLDTQLAQLKEANVKVHTIALSDQVDKALLRALSTQTGGWMETAKTASALQRAFLHMLEQAATPTTAPIKDNAFEIDSQVSEFTLLAFHDKDKTTTLVSPSGKSFTSKSHPMTATWREETGYDLVTLHSPEVGKWQLQGVTDPDNRVALVTDLGINIGPFPSAIARGSAPGVEAWLTDHQQPVTRDDLLELVTAEASVTAAGGAAVAGQPGALSAPTEGGKESTAEGGAHEEKAKGGHAQNAADHNGAETHKSTGDHKDAGAVDGQAGQEHPAEAPPGKVTLNLDAKTGRFGGNLTTDALPPGDYELHVNLDGGTFKREVVKHFEVSGPPLQIAFSQKAPVKPGDPAALLVSFDGKPALVDPSSLGGYLVLAGPEQEEQVVELPQAKRLPTGFRLTIAKPGQYSVKGRVMGRSPRGEPLDVKIEPQEFTFDFAVPDTEGEQTHEEAEHEPIAWVEMLMYVGGGNALLGMALGLTLWLLRRPKKDDGKGKPAKGTTATRKKK